MKIEALHDFHNTAFAEEWAQKFKPNSERIQLFETMLDHIQQMGRVNLHILELGIGPGFLADYLLNRLETITYEGLDFSQPMLDIAAQRLARFEDRTTFTQGDLTKDDWATGLGKKPDVVVSTWALHDLFHQDNIFSVYRNSAKVLREGGLLLNGDFIKPEESEMEYEGGRIKPSLHLSLLKKAGFQSAACLREFEKDVLHPTTANNYACFLAKT